MSSDESSDDELLNGPAFGAKRKTRATEAAESRMLDFLDQCVEKETEKADRRGRIEDMMREDDEDAGGGGADGRKGEDDEGGGDGKPVKNEGAKDGSKDMEMTDADPAAASSAGASGDGTAKKGGNDEKGFSPDGPPPSAPAQAKPKPKLIDTDDPAYWDRIERAAAGEDDGVLGNLSRGARRRFIADAAEGLDDLTDDDVDYGEDSTSSSDEEMEEAATATAAGGGKEGDFSIGRPPSKAAAAASAATALEERRKRRAMASAAATGRSSNLGTRRAFFAPLGGGDGHGGEDDKENGGRKGRGGRGRKRKREPKVLPGGIRLYHSHDEATSELKAVLKAIEKEAQKGIKARGGGAQRRRGRSADAARAQASSFIIPVGEEERTLALIKRLRASADADLLPEALERDAQKRRRNDGGSIGGSRDGVPPSVPKELALWLWGAACSSSKSSIAGQSGKGDKNKGGSGGALVEGGAIEPLARAAFLLLEIALEHGGVFVADEEERGEEGSPAASAASLTRISDLVPCLTEGFGLWAGPGPTPVPVEQQADDDDDENSGGEKERPPCAQPIDADGTALKHFFRLWAAALGASGGQHASWEADEGHLGGDGDEDDVEESSPIVVASKCLAALSRAGIDPGFHCGEGLTEPLQALMLSLAESTSGRDEGSDDWAHIAAGTIVDSLSDLGPGRSGDDADDEEGWLPLVLAIRTLPVVGGLGTPFDFSGPAARLKAAAACDALRSCLGIGGADEDMWNDKVREWMETHLRGDIKSRWREDEDEGDEEKKDGDKDGDEEKKGDKIINFPLRWSSIFHAETGLLAIEHLGDGIFDDGPRFHAAVELACICLETGVELFRDEGAGGDKERGGGRGAEKKRNVKVGAGVYRNVEEAGAASDAYERIEEGCGRLKKVVKSVFTNPHLRRAKELLTRIETHCRHKKVEASEAAARRRGDGTEGMVQKSLAGWISSGNDAEESQDAEEPQDGEDSQDAQESQDAEEMQDVKESHGAEEPQEQREESQD